MAHVKIASIADWKESLTDESGRLVKVSRFGLKPNDAADLRKFAGDMFVHMVKQAESNFSPDCTYVHCVSCGASDFFGPNRNGDGWTAATLERDMPSYIKHARLYRDHDNKQTSPHYGRVKVAFYDAERGYGRVLAEYNSNHKAARDFGGRIADRELQKLANDGQIAVSHGVNVGNDVCVICSNVATKKAEYCLPKSEGGTCELFGCRHGLTKIADDGRIQFVDNPKSIFYDLSDVGTPADRIAYGLLYKQASVDVAPRYDLFMDSFGSTPLAASLKVAASKLAAYEDILGASAKDDHGYKAMVSAIAGDPTDVVNVAGLVSSDPYVRRGAAYKLAQLKQLPSAGQLAKAAGMTDAQATKVDSISVGLTSKLMSLGQLEGILKTSAFTTATLSPLVHPLASNVHAPGYAFDDASLTKRATAFSLIDYVGSVPTVDLADSTADILKVACDYTALKIAMAAQFFLHDDNMLRLFAYPRRTTY
jgi:hypothetical protein